MSYEDIPTDLLEQLRKDAAQILGCDIDELPPDLPPKDTAKILHVKPSTLSIWRSTGRYDLRYYKLGRLIRYPTDDSLRWKGRRLRHHT